jgi:Flp pilus assembly protein TadG
MARRILSRLRSDRRGLAMLEFAIVAPVMVTMATAGFDIARALIAWQEVQAAAEWAAAGAAILSVQADSSTSLTLQQAQAAMSSIYGTIPQVKSKLWTGAYGITMSSVQWSCSSNCTVFTPYLAWTTSLYGLAPSETTSNIDTAFFRTCGTALQQVAAVPSDSTVLTTVPTLNVSTNSNFVMVDIHFQYVPLLPFAFITGPIDFYTTFTFPNPIGANNQPIVFDGGYTNDTKWNCVVPVNS